MTRIYTDKKRMLQKAVGMIHVGLSEDKTVERWLCWIRTGASGSCADPLSPQSVSIREIRGWFFYSSSLVCGYAAPGHLWAIQSL